MFPFIVDCFSKEELALQFSFCISNNETDFIAKDGIFQRNIRMIEKLTKNLTQFYQISFVVIMIAALGVIFYFWKLGFIDGSRSKELHKAGFTLEKITDAKAVGEIRSYIIKENPKKSLEAIELFESEIEGLHRLVEDKSYQPAFEELQRLKTGVANLISFANSSKVLSVFNDKMDKFSEYVKTNDWRTLTRMSERVLNISQEASISGNLSKVVKSIENDFDSMVKITENSILSRADKSEIKSRISNMRVETSMLKKHLDERALSLGLIKNFEQKFQTWLEKISPELSLQKLQVERMGRYYVMGMLGILGLTSMLFFCGFLFNRWAIKASQAKLEERIKELVADGIIGREEFQAENYSKDFQDFARKTSEYVNKRMSFGTIFQEALPFSSLMLDKNLKVEWTNKQFCSDWEISEEEAGQDYMSWDYLAKLTNLGHDDPVLEALKHDVAGIYQIQVKPTEETETRPYEMFVSPVKHDGQKKIMLFFYPLLSMRETIKDQAISIVNPIDKTLRMMMDDQFIHADKEQLRKEYEVGGITRMLDMFETLDKKREAERKNLLNQIEMLYGFMEQTQKSADEAYDLNSQAFESAKGQVRDLRVFKEGVISLSQSAKELESFCSEFNQHFNDALDDLEGFQNDFGSLKNSMEDMAVSLPNLDRLKDDIKVQRAQVSESKAKLGQGLASLIHIKKGISHPEIVKKFQAAYEKVYGYFEQMDMCQTGLEKRLVQLEVSLSKAQMLINSAHKGSEGLVSAQNFHAVKAKREKRALMNEKAQSMQGKSSKSEEMIIHSLQSIYKGHKENLKRQALIAKSLDLPEQQTFLDKGLDKGKAPANETTM